VQLLGLSPTCSSSSSKQQLSRSQLYTSAVLQHAALLLLLLVSDGLLLLTLAASVPATVLQALHVLTKVKQLLLQQLQALQRQDKLQQKLTKQQDGKRQQGLVAGSTNGSDGGTERAAVQQYGRLIQLLQQKLPTQLHVVLQVRQKFVSKRLLPYRLQPAVGWCKLCNRIEHVIGLACGRTS
jgi:hypothetical protein